MNPSPFTRFIAVFLSLSLGMCAPGSDALVRAFAEGEGRQQAPREGAAQDDNVTEIDLTNEELQAFYDELMRRPELLNLVPREVRDQLAHALRVIDPNVDIGRGEGREVTAAADRLLRDIRDGGVDPNLALGRFFDSVGTFARQSEEDWTYRNTLWENSSGKEVAVMNSATGRETQRMRLDLLQDALDRQRIVVRRANPRTGELEISDVVFKWEEGGDTKEEIAYSARFNDMLKALVKAFGRDALLEHGDMPLIRSFCSPETQGNWEDCRAEVMAWEQQHGFTGVDFPVKIIEYLKHARWYADEGKLDTLDYNARDLTPAELREVQNAAREFYTLYTHDNVRRQNLRQLINLLVRELGVNQNPIADINAMSTQEVQAQLEAFRSGNISGRSWLMRFMGDTKIDLDEDLPPDLKRFADQTISFLEAGERARLAAFQDAGDRAAMEARLDEVNFWNAQAQMNIQRFELGAYGRALDDLANRQLKDGHGLAADDPGQAEIVNLQHRREQVHEELGVLQGRYQEAMLANIVADLAEKAYQLRWGQHSPDVRREMLATMRAKSEEIRSITKGPDGAETERSREVATWLSSNLDVEIDRLLGSNLDTGESVRRAMESLQGKLPRLARLLGFEGGVPDGHDAQERMKGFSVLQSKLNNAASQLNIQMQMFDVLHQLDIAQHQYMSESEGNFGNLWGLLSRPKEWWNREVGMKYLTPDAWSWQGGLHHVVPKAYEMFGSDEGRAIFDGALQHLKRGNYNAAMVALGDFDPEAYAEGEELARRMIQNDYGFDIDIQTSLTRSASNLEIQAASKVLQSAFGELQKGAMSYMAGGVIFDLAWTTALSAVAMPVLAPALGAMGRGLMGIEKGAEMGRLARFGVGSLNFVGKWASFASKNIVNATELNINFQNVQRAGKLATMGNVALQMAKQVPNTAWKMAQYNTRMVGILGLVSGGIGVATHQFAGETSQFQGNGDAFAQSAIGGASWAAKYSPAMMFLFPTGVLEGAQAWYNPVRWWRAYGEASGPVGSLVKQGTRFFQGVGRRMGIGSEAVAARTAPTFWGNVAQHGPLTALNISANAMTATGRMGAVGRSALRASMMPLGLIDGAAKYMGAAVAFQEVGEASHYHWNRFWNPEESRLRQMRDANAFGHKAAAVAFLFVPSPPHGEPGSMRTMRNQTRAFDYIVKNNLASRALEIETQMPVTAGLSQRAGHEVVRGRQTRFFFEGRAETHPVMSEPLREALARQVLVEGKVTMGELARIMYAQPRARIQVKSLEGVQGGSGTLLMASEVQKVAKQMFWSRAARDPNLFRTIRDRKAGEPLELDGVVFEGRNAEKLGLEVAWITIRDSYKAVESSALRRVNSSSVKAELDVIAQELIPTRGRTPEEIKTARIDKARRMVEIVEREVQAQVASFKNGKGEAQQWAIDMLASNLQTKLTTRYAGERLVEKALEGKANAAESGLYLDVINETMKSNMMEVFGPSFKGFREAQSNLIRSLLEYLETPLARSRTQQRGVSNLARRRGNELMEFLTEKNWGAVDVARTTAQSFMTFQRPGVDRVTATGSAKQAAATQFLVETKASVKDLADIANTHVPRNAEGPVATKRIGADTLPVTSEVVAAAREILMGRFAKSPKMIQTIAEQKGETLEIGGERITDRATVETVRDLAARSQLQGEWGGMVELIATKLDVNMTRRQAAYEKDIQGGNVKAREPDAVEVLTGKNGALDTWIGELPNAGRAGVRRWAIERTRPILEAEVLSRWVESEAIRADAQGPSGATRIASLMRTQQRAFERAIEATEAQGGRPRRFELERGEMVEYLNAIRNEGLDSNVVSDFVFRGAANKLNLQHSLKAYLMLQTGGGKTLVAFAGLMPLAQALARRLKLKGVIFATLNATLKAQGIEDYKEYFRGEEPDFKIMTYSELNSEALQAKIRSGRSPYEEHLIIGDELDGLALQPPLSTGKNTGKISVANPVHRLFRDLATEMRTKSFDALIKSEGSLDAAIEAKATGMAREFFDIRSQTPRASEHWREIENFRDVMNQNSPSFRRMNYARDFFRQTISRFYEASRVNEPGTVREFDFETGRVIPNHHGSFYPTLDTPHLNYFETVGGRNPRTGKFEYFDVTLPYRHTEITNFKEVIGSARYMFGLSGTVPNGMRPFLRSIDMQIVGKGTKATPVMERATLANEQAFHRRVVERVRESLEFMGERAEFTRSFRPVDYAESVRVVEALKRSGVAEADILISHRVSAENVTMVTVRGRNAQQAQAIERVLEAEKATDRFSGVHNLVGIAYQSPEEAQVIKDLLIAEGLIKPGELRFTSRQIDQAKLAELVNAVEGGVLRRSGENYTLRFRSQADAEMVRDQIVGQRLMAKDKITLEARGDVAEAYADMTYYRESQYKDAEVDARVNVNGIKEGRVKVAFLDINNVGRGLDLPLRYRYNGTTTMIKLHAQRSARVTSNQVSGRFDPAGRAQGPLIENVRFFEYTHKDAVRQDLVTREAKVVVTTRLRTALQNRADPLRAAIGTQLFGRLSQDTAFTPEQQRQIDEVLETALEGREAFEEFLQREGVYEHFVEAFQDQVEQSALRSSGIGEGAMSAEQKLKMKSMLVQMATYGAAWWTLGALDVLTGMPAMITAGIVAQLVKYFYERREKKKLAPAPKPLKEGVPVEEAPEMKKNPLRPRSVFGN